MGLFDIFKNKPESAPAPGATPTPAPADGSAAAPAAPKSGPRYQGSNYVAPGPPAPMPVPAPGQQFMPPPMPEMPAPGEMPELPFQPENVLEELLLIATVNEAARPDFYRALLGEEVLLVLAPQEGQEPGEATLEEGAQIQLQVLQDNKIPIFSSVARMSDNGVDNGPVTYVRIPGHAFFQMTQGQDVVLNPFSAAGKLLPADEIGAMLSGQLTQAGGLPPDAQVTLSQPENLPEGLEDSLRAFGATVPTVRAIYLAQMGLANDPAQPPRLLLAFDTTDQNPEFLPQLGPALEGHTGEYQHVDLMLLDLNSDEGVNPYFKMEEVQPVYVVA
ncbi:MAG TPA: enhanced serine sensitivity protein SseB C-terminal domain-containing protein [Hymenobacter sp.]|uniref:enhanced serine sensitivity protein SseB C-terminal domain-containing protein n=1 Tax=Hymenobacter sp. TaxID=1898978 RepID=UPI002D80ADDD|nr:enhanced serine sensitivity protein SseB C-terminal domain-containing protein [Hymenobacter sp.]HET9504589.1 enhanced serine sensitivity protein SseB C-terminal domain-containing protein [Hymenobacter sp.]